jgi:hypothetical protein
MGCDCDKARLAIRQLAGAAKMNRGTGIHAVHLQVFRGLARAHRSGALAALAGGGGLGSLEPGSWSYEPASLDAEAEAFDGRLNAWMNDYAAVANRLPAALVQQIDDYIQRWRKLKDSSYFFTGARGAAILQLEAEWNRFRDQVASYTGSSSAITPATVTVDGQEVRADQVPAGSSTIDKVERIAKWGAIIIGGAAAIKVASDLGVFAKARKLAGA